MEREVKSRKREPAFLLPDHVHFTLSAVCGFPSA